MEVNIIRLEIYMQYFANNCIRLFKTLIQIIIFIRKTMKQNNFYLIGDVDIHNINEYKIYIQNVKPIVEKYGGEYLVRGGEIIEKEINLWKPKRFVLVRFPDKSSALKFYNSKEYKPYKNIRLKNATSTITFAEGFH